MLSPYSHYDVLNRSGNPQKQVGIKGGRGWGLLPVDTLRNISPLEIQPIDGVVLNISTPVITSTKLLRNHSRAGSTCWSIS